MRSGRAYLVSTRDCRYRNALCSCEVRGVGEVWSVHGGGESKSPPCECKRWRGGSARPTLNGRQRGACALQSTPQNKERNSVRVGYDEVLHTIATGNEALGSTIPHHRQLAPQRPWLWHCNATADTDTQRHTPTSFFSSEVARLARFKHTNNESWNLER